MRTSKIPLQGGCLGVFFCSILDHGKQTITTVMNQFLKKAPHPLGQFGLGLLLILCIYLLTYSSSLNPVESVPQLSIGELLGEEGEQVAINIFDFRPVLGEMD